MDSLTYTRLTKYKKKPWIQEEDFVVEEQAVTIFVNDVEIATLVASPWDMELLCIGFLASEGMIRSKNDLESYTYDDKHQFFHCTVPTFRAELTKSVFLKRHVHSCCGRSRASVYFKSDALLTHVVDSDLVISEQIVFHATRTLEEKAKLFQKTGGVHSCALFDRETLLSYHMDIGRHNTLDRILGESILKNIALEHKILMFSGRVASEIILKVSKMNIPVIISRSAPSSYAIDLANEFHITLISFSREDRFSVYTHAERVEHGL